MRRRETVTIADVAREARVSVATVSRVLNGATTVDGELAERVRASVRRLGYRPNVSARRLATGTTGTVGVVVPDLANPYHHGVLKGLAEAARGDGVSLLVADSNEDARDELPLATDLLAQVDGLILCSPRMPRVDLLAVLDGGRPVVAVNTVVHGVGMPSVSFDAHAGTLSLCGHLASLGHRRVVYLAGPETSWSARERWRALTAAGAFGVEAVVVEAGSTLADGAAAVDRALGTRASALVGFNDLVALGALAGLRERGVAVPGEVSVTGFDDIPFAAFTAPALTTVRSHGRDLGRAGWHLLSRLLGGERAVDSELVATELVVRESTGPAPARRP
jgi:LacI family transcriptional regulator